ncbi:hypothetical protein HG536_0D03730 [Torulaspora globosa]|uniref:Nitrogen permease regulator 3 n=1 Tax=Torulaspora globosa TaxID=48254 RepID=A0A7G3ZH65_9SACH|nr:uncharacterized protein HG536_0D03730 [Torulaspora globosa]QLL32851.1 hypothetical protein HG536_0D03730 [Torulaspora globosa]
MSEFLPNSCLVGIHLTIFTHSGPQVVFHYPPSVVGHLKSRERQNKRDPSSLDKEVKYDRSSVDFGRNSSISGPLTSHSARSSEYRPQGDEATGSPKVDSNSGNFRSKGSSDWAKRDESKKPEMDSDVGSSSSGLSDSELSTDYADCSSSSSSESHSYEEAEKELNDFGYGDLKDDTNVARPSMIMLSHANNSFSSEFSHSSKLLRAKSSQISASKLLDIISTDNQNRRPSRASAVSSVQGDEGPKEEEEISNTEEEIERMIAKGTLNFDETHFTEENFQDLTKVFGFDPEFVAEFCSPEREMCNARFEFTVDDLCFLGLPVHVDANGQWRRSRRKKHFGRSKRSSSSGTKGGSVTRGSGLNDNDSSYMENSSSMAETNVFSDNIRRSETSDIAKPDDLRNSMDMFHVCFVMNPSLVEYNKRVDDMFHYVVTRLSILLRYSQAKSAYVSKQCNLILKEKEKVLKSSKAYQNKNDSGRRAKYLYQRLFAKSSLARALITCVDKLQRNEIACLEIDDDKVISLQIPIQNEFRHLPNFKLHPVLKGSYLTSILNARFLGSSPTRDNIRDSSMIRDKYDDDYDDDLLNYALLLLDEPSSIIRELESLSSDDDIGNMVLIHLIKRLQPTVALRSYQDLFNQLLGSSTESSTFSGSQNSFHTSMLRSCALHLLYRRHARVIIPISSKNTYIVSPLAPIGSHPQEDYHDIDEISALRRPLIYQNQEKFKKRFPSLPSLVSFLNLLSTKKPKPFGSIIPSKEHKPIYLGALTWLMRFGYVTQLLTFVCIRVDKQIKMAVEEDLEKEAPRVRKDNLNRDNNKMDNFSKETDFVSQMIPQSQLYHSEDDVDNYAFDDHNMEKDYTIILEPERATAIEKRWIFKCIQDQPTDIQFLFNKVLKYFNGKTPMELVLIREEITRHELKRILNALPRYCVEFHHW